MCRGDHDPTLLKYADIIHSVEHDLIEVGQFTYCFDAK